MRYAFSATLALTFAVQIGGCREAQPLEPVISGSLVVSNVTTGGAFDPDGFVLVIDGARTFPLELNETKAVGDLTDAPYRVELLGVAPNCAVSGGITRTVTVPKGAQAKIDFTVSCVPPAELASTRMVFAHWGAPGQQLTAMNADGSGRVKLTDGFWDSEPAVSPDGTTIVFTRENIVPDPYRGDPDLFTMNADRSGVRRLVQGPAYSPDWSPDGRSIAFSDITGFWGGSIHVLPVDGGAGRIVPGHELYPEDAGPRWSPDGTRIALIRDEGRNVGIWVVRSDGSGAARLIGPNPDARNPVWSPDSRRIAYTADRGSGITFINVINADGTAVETLIEGRARWGVHDWSPDGRMLLLTREIAGDSSRSDIFLFRLSDSALVRLTADGSTNRSPRFWPSAGLALAQGRTVSP